jgi:hydrophobe/amphiphile efflux-1 (HAE1) family protein
VISHFFIDRPIFAAVLSIVITLAGGVAVFTLPVAQYPDITPPTVLVTAIYPGANARTVLDTVAAPIEQQVSGVENMLYMSSLCTNDGTYTLTVTFRLGTDSDMAQVLVQNRVSLAMPAVPALVQREGVNVKKMSPNTMMIVNLYSPEGHYDNIFLSNYATIQIKDELGRLPGVANVGYLGERDYSMRAWLDPDKLASLSLSAGDVVTAVGEQNLQVAAGQIGQQPVPAGQQFQLTINTLGRLTDREQFENIILKVGQQGLSSSGTLIGGPSLAGGPSMSGLGTAPGMSSTAGGGGVAGGAALSGGVGMFGQSAIATPNPLPSQRMTGQTTSSGSSSSSGSSGAGMTPMLQGGASTPGAASKQPSLSAMTSNPTKSGTSGGTAGPGAGTTASVVRLKDVARIELGSQQYDQSCTLEGRPSVALSLYQLPGSNALQTAKGVYDKMNDLKQRFPDDLDYKIVYDTTPFISESIAEVFKTLRDAIILVAIVVLVFLQNWRATLIPLIAVPVAIVGTFAVMAALGFSLNNLSLFGLVLAIGIVVDDAIVVVENVERWLEQELPPREAARKAMDEVTSPVIAVALVLVAVFVPCAFISGITGQFFRQFAVTIATSTVISAFNSLTLSPALAALILKPHGAARDPLTWLLDVSLGWFFKLFNKTFELSTAVYTRMVGGLLRVSLVVLAVYGGLLVLTYVEFQRVPTGFVPQQDKGYLLVNVQLPDSASVERTQGAMAHIEKIALDTTGVAHTVGISGQSLLLAANAPNLGSMYVMLKEFSERRGHSADDIAAELRARCSKEVRSAIVTIFGAPPIDGLGTTGGFKMIVEDRSNLGLDRLQAVSDEIVFQGNETPGLEGLFNSSRVNTPWLYLDIDRAKCMAVGITVKDVFDTLQIYFGSYYVNLFNEFGRSWQVNVMAEAKFRDRVAQILVLKVRNVRGQMVPLGSVLSVDDSSGPVALMRYNMYSATAVTGNLAPGTSSGQAIQWMEKIADHELEPSMAYDWTELTYMQLQAGNTAVFVFALAVVFVFLVLAAQYESWKLPLAVILVVPMCLLCSVVGVDWARLDVNIFTQIGFVVLVGLASKNAILIVEFAKQQQESGVERRQAVLEASRLRLRPILMTSFAFILGVVPLVVAHGAGAEMRQTLGIAVFSGMLGVTLFGIFLTPVFYDVIQHFGKPPAPIGAASAADLPDPPHAH